MTLKKGLPYGLDFTHEYEEYKKLCSRKNKKRTYTVWYKKIRKKYDCYDAERLRDLEKYLNLLVRKKRECIDKIVFLERIASYVVSICMPIAAIVVSLMTYFDSIQSALDEVMLKKAIDTSIDSGDFQIVAEQLQYRLDMFSRMVKLFIYAGYITIFYIFVMLAFYIVKQGFQKKEMFLKDYRDCILEIKEEKEVKQRGRYIFYV